MFRFPLLSLLCSLGLCLSLLGCGGGPDEDGPKRYPVQGKVTFDGRPVDGGTITFVPVVADQSMRPTGGPIVNGEYNVPEEKGGNQGLYKVQISWLQPTGKQAKDSDTGEMKDVMKESIPPQFNTATTLEADLSEEKTQFDFDLKSK